MTARPRETRAPVARPRTAGDALRVALVAGTLGRGGAEKQLTYLARALRDAGVAVRVYALTRDECYAAELRAHGLPPVWIGRRPHPAGRLVTLVGAAARFRPHVVHAGHFFANLYAAGAARAAGAVAVGSIREDPRFGLAQNGRWGPWLLRLPHALVANSEAARRQVVQLGRDAGRVHVLANVIDLADFDARARAAAPRPDTAGAMADGAMVAVGRLIAVKRFDRFLDALALARRDAPRLTGAIVGDGPERPALEARAARLGLLPDGVRFLGQRDDVPALLQRAGALVLTSDQEGFPNVVLEGMAAALPIVTTPAGDAPMVVQDGVTGYVIPFEDVSALARRLVALAAAPELRRSLGAAGRRRAEQRYAPTGLADRLLAIYAAVAERERHARLREALGRARRIGDDVRGT
ncbi:MAG TPA: glycosyltransferase [Gemmatimonadaceae bacterium]|nr:glycosyltransferase [Gemmatimonadaceae bacterium]